MTRRDFVRSAVGMAAVGVSRGAMASETQDQRQDLPAGGQRKHPILISSGNGIPACNTAMQSIRAGADPLDAVVEGINLVENNPDDHSVGYGGLPNEEGVVQLDACVMDGRTHTGGGVAALENIRNPSSVALLVMRRTDHVLIVGDGALQFARAHGFKAENLLTDEARRIWLKWKESHSDNDDWLQPEAGDEAARRLPRERPEFTWGTITCLALLPNDDLVGCTSTSGLSYKIPGRVGDSPILGAGLYVDNTVGACGSTGRGESNLQTCASFMVVEFMRQGMTPEEACRAQLKRIVERTERRLLNRRGEPKFGLTFYAVRKDGLVGGAAMRDGANMTVHDGVECRHVELPYLYKSPAPDAD